MILSVTPSVRWTMVLLEGPRKRVLLALGVYRVQGPGGTAVWESGFQIVILGAQKGFLQVRWSP